MRVFLWIAPFVFFLLFFSPVALATDAYPFTQPAQAAQFEHLTHAMRCLVCQNQSLAESTAPFAQDLKHEIYEAIQQGQRDPEIAQMLVLRYGDAILFEPPWEPRYYGLWLAPGLLLGLGLLVLYRYWKQHWKAPC